MVLEKKIMKIFYLYQKKHTYKKNNYYFNFWKKVPKYKKKNYNEKFLLIKKKPQEISITFGLKIGKMTWINATDCCFSNLESISVLASWVVTVVRLPNDGPFWKYGSRLANQRPTIPQKQFTIIIDITQSLLTSWLRPGSEIINEQKKNDKKITKKI